MFCPHCGKPNKEGGKFCVHCGKSLTSSKGPGVKVNQVSEPTSVIVPKTIDPKKIEKWKNSVKNAGNSAFGFGWLQIIVGSALFIWYLLDKNFAESGLGGKFDAAGFVLILYFASVFIVLGKRIRTLKDPRTNRYLNILLVLSFVLIGLSLTNGGFTGIIFLLMFISIISGASNIGKLMKQESFRADLSAPHHKVTTLWWVGISVLAIVAFFLAALYVPAGVVASSTPNQANNQVPKEWIAYSAEKGNFSALLPIQPTYTTDSQKIENSDITTTADTYESSSEDGSSYLIDYIHYDGKVDFSDPNAVLKNLLDGMVGNSADNKLISSANTSVSGNGALDFEIQNGIYTLKGRLIVKGETAYRLVMTQETSKLSESDYSKFVSGFALK